MIRLALIATHPIQYYSPWFRYIAEQSSGVQLKVFYLWDFGVTDQVDQGFSRKLRWDIDLLDGYEHEFVPNVSSQPGTSSFWGLNNPQLADRVNAFKPDAALMMAYRYIGLLRFMRQNRVPLIFRGDSHRIVSQTGWKAALKKHVIQFLFRSFDACLYVGQANRGYFLEHGIDADRLFFSPHAIDNQRFRDGVEETKQRAAQMREELGIPAEATLALFVGKFEQKKRPLDLVQAFNQVTERHDAYLLMVGNGVLESNVRAAAAPNPRVKLLEFQNQTAMPAVYAMSNVLVLPSFGAYETWGLVVNEAMNLGCPVIVSSHVGCGADLVEDGRTGWIFEAGRVDDLAAALDQAFSDPDRLNIMGQTAKEKISGYSYQQATEGLNQALKELLG